MTICKAGNFNWGGAFSGIDRRIRIDNNRIWRDNLNMTVIADNEKRVVLPQAQPSERFDVQVCENGFVLRKVESDFPRYAKVTFIKRDGFTVAMADLP